MTGLVYCNSIRLIHQFGQTRSRCGGVWITDDIVALRGVGLCVVEFFGECFLGLEINPARIAIALSPQRIAHLLNPLPPGPRAANLREGGLLAIALWVVEDDFEALAVQALGNW